MKFLSIVGSLRIFILSTTIEVLERIFFFPRFRRLIKNEFSGHTGTFIAIDIGSNRGQTVSALSQAFGSRLELIGFEPNQRLLAILRRSFPHFKFYGSAISDTNGQGQFYVSRLDQTSSLTKPDESSLRYRLKSVLLGLDLNRDFQSISCEVSTLDAVLDNNQEFMPSFIKIDTEGAELSVLRGASKTLRLPSLKVIQLEVHSDGMRENDEAEIIEILRLAGFKEFARIGHAFGGFKDVFFRRLS